MNFEGKMCGVCNESKLHAFKDEFVEGVYVDAYKCGKGHVSYSRDVMQKMEALQKATSEERHLVKVGSSVAAPIPASIVRMFKLKPKEKVYVSVHGNRIIIMPTPA